MIRVNFYSVNAAFIVTRVSTKVKFFGLTNLHNNVGFIIIYRDASLQIACLRSS